MTKDPKIGTTRKKPPAKPPQGRSQRDREHEGLLDRYAPGHCTMCEIRWGRFDQPEDTVRVIRELQDIQKWLFYMRKYTNMTTPDGEDPDE